MEKPCDTCKAQTRVKCRMKFEILPKIMAIHLKRWQTDPSGTKKLDIPVYFSTTRLSMREFVHTNSLCNTLLKQNNFDYDLYAFIVHLGSMPNSGHYSVYCKHPYNKNWYHFDDAK